MIKKLFIKLSIFAFLFALLIPATTTLAAADDPYGVNNIGVNGLTNHIDPKEATVRIVNLVLGFLGLIAVIIILIGGFKWMTAGGNEEKVGEAKKLLIAGLIGLVIILLAWGIATWVVGTVVNVT